MTPIPSATAILLKNTHQGIEVLVLKRNKAVKFLGGMWVFPGGAIEPHDITDCDMETARNAAVRETLEESGLSIDADKLVPFSQWVTPEGAPKRYSTWFFFAEASDEDVQCDGSEIIESLWTTPEDVISRHRRQDIDILPPTLVSLLAIQPFSSTDELLTYYKNRQPVIFTPRAFMHQDQLVMLYPGDHGFEQEDPAVITCQHRCLHTDKGWHYINQLEGSL